MNSSAMLKAHGEKLFNAIDMAVNSLDDLNTLVPILIQLGYSHCRWGVKEEHFQVLKYTKI
jgi:hemoglobin-like flavoprotein